MLIQKKNIMKRNDLKTSRKWCLLCFASLIQSVIFTEQPTTTPTLCFGAVPLPISLKANRDDIIRTILIYLIIVIHF